MGEVYRARDSRLHRDVAIKVLPESFASDPDRLSRFQREARVLASLNHTNIAHVYGLEQTEGLQAIVMELVEGSTLAESPKMAPAEALPIAIQIASALEAAHEHGVIHRDLKPANIKVMSDGTVKVLDFGLAKAIGPERSHSDVPAMHSPTITSPAMTQLGVILGTAAYMSPEQARGRVVDRRADIWAFGCVLFELLTGRRTFGGDDVSDTLAFVLTKEPEWATLPPDTHPIVARLLRRCLEKDPKRRLHDIADARLDLEEALAAPAAAVASVPVQSASSSYYAVGPHPHRLSELAHARAGRRRWVWPAALVAASSIAAFVTWAATRPAGTPAPPVQRLTIAIPTGAPYPGGELVVSPDGKRVVYAATVGNQTMLYSRELDRLDAQPIKGTEGALYPFFSPSGELLGFSARGKLQKVSVRGGPPVTICDVQSRGVSAAWGPDDTIVFSDVLLVGSGLLRVAAAGGVPTPLTTPDESKKEGRHRWPVFLPGGKSVLFTILGGGMSTYDTAGIAVLSLETGKYRTVIERGYHARIVSTGHVVYAAGPTLMAVAFDLDRLETRGPAVPVVEGVGPAGSNSDLLGHSAFDVTAAGLLVYAPSNADTSQQTLVWIDREGREQPTGVPPHSYVFPRISPDGTRIATTVRQQGSDIWIWNVASRTFTRLTLSTLTSLPIWSRDGKRIIFGSSPVGGVYSIFRQAADGSGNPDRLTESPLDQHPYQTTPDDRQLLVQENDRSSINVMLMNLDGDRRATPLLSSSANESTASVSPDGKWLAYGSDESGRVEVYVRPFPKIGEGRRQVSTEGGGGPIWTSAGRELVYVRNSGAAIETWAVPMKDGAPDGRPRVLFRGPYVGFLNLNYDVTPDGSRFLMVKPIETSSTESTDFVAVLNWGEDLKRLAPARAK
jgi:serine/threonine-protein kinase